MVADDQNERVGRAADSLIFMVRTLRLSPKEGEVALLAAYRAWLLMGGLSSEEVVERATLGLTLLAVPIGSVPV